MKKPIKSFLEFALVTGIMIFALKLTAFAQGSLPIAETPFQSADIPAPPQGQSGQETARQLVMAGLGYVKTIIAVLGVLYITITGYRLVAGGDNEETVTKAKQAMTYIVIAFVLISMSQDIARIFDMETGTLLGSPQEILNRVQLYDRQVEIFITFIKLVIGAYATLMIVRSGFRLVTGSSKEDTVTEQRQSIIYSVTALLIVTIGDVFIDRVFYRVDKEVYSGITGVHPQIDAKAGVEELIGITNLIVKFAAPVAMLFIIIAALMYATAAGNEDQMNKAKRIFLVIVVGILIIYGAFALVNTIVSSSLADLGAIAE